MSLGRKRQESQRGWKAGRLGPGHRPSSSVYLSRKPFRKQPEHSTPDSPADVKMDIAELVHNLRGPIQVALYNLDMAKAADGDRSMMESLKDATAAIRRINTITTAILILSRSATNKVLVHKQRTDMLRLLNEVVSFWKTMARVSIRHIELPGIDPELDEFHIKQVLENLISNALKYGSAAFIDMDSDHANLRIHVSDRGPGFDAGNASRSPHSRSQGSFGIGLKYCEKIVEAHGGTMTKENITDATTGIVHGGRVTIQIPLRSPEKKP